MSMMNCWSNIKNMVKRKQYRNESDWRKISIKITTAKLLQQFQLDHDLLTYDQAINLMYNMLENKK